MRLFNKKPTAEEIAAKEMENKRKKAERRLKTKTLRECGDLGINMVRQRLLFLKESNTVLPEPLLSREDNIMIIEESLEELNNKIKKNEENISSGQQTIS